MTYFTGYAIIQFPETILSLYQHIKQSLAMKKSSTSYEQKTKISGKRNLSQGDKDIQKLNQLLCEKRGNWEKPVLNASTEENKECSSLASIKTLIEILSRTIARMDELESKQQQNTEKCFSTNEIEEYQI